PGHPPGTGGGAAVLRPGKLGRLSGPGPDRGGVQRAVSAGHVGGGATYRPAGRAQCRLAHPDRLRLLPARAAPIGLYRRAFRHPLDLRHRRAAGHHRLHDRRGAGHAAGQGGGDAMIAPQHRIYACFFLFAVATGALMARMPDIQTHLGVTEGQLGLTMIGMSIGSLISLTVGAPVIERLGFRTTAFFTTLGPSLLFATIPFLPSAPFMFAVLFLVGLLSGALEINLNVEIDRLEARTGKRFMNRAHGFW